MTAEALSINGSLPLSENCTLTLLLVSLRLLSMLSQARLALLGMRIDDDWHVDAGRVKVEMLFRPRPTTAKVQVLIFEFRGEDNTRCSHIPAPWLTAC